MAAFKLNINEDCLMSSMKVLELNCNWEENI